MTIVTICLVWMNFFTSTAELYQYLYVDLNDSIAKKVEVIQTISAGIPERSEEEQRVLKQKLDGQKYELALLYREKRNRTVNWAIRLTIPLFVVVFVICMLLAVHKKAIAAHEFNVDLIETNTSSLRNSTQDLHTTISVIDSLVSSSDAHRKIGELFNVTTDHKREIYESIKTIIDKYEKCNFILEAQKNQLPFPYSDLAINGFMIIVTVLCLIYVYSQFKPMARLRQIKDLNKMREEALIADKKNIKMLRKELELLMTCHEDDIDAVIFTLKVVFFIFIITFLVFYSTKVISSANEYKSGLYNSFYYDNNVCV